MFRTAIVRALRTTTATRSAAPAFRAQITPSFVRTQTPVSRITAIRCYASGSGLNEEEVTGRILDLLKNFDKVQDPTKLSPTSHFVKDLSLDSLDTVEVVMAIEEEFSIEIPDKAADAIHSVNEAVKYILEQPDAH